MDLEIHISTRSFTLTGSGEGFGSIIDSDVVFDDLGIPYLPARRIKGLLLDKSRDIQEILNPTMNIFPKSLLKDLFGETGKNSESAYFENLVIPDYENITSWLKYSYQGKLSQFINKYAIMNYWTKIIQSTATTIKGIAKPHSLRTIRALNPNILFIGKIQFNEVNKKGIYLLSLACAHLNRLGSKRNRGLGKIECKLYHNGTDLVEKALHDLSKEKVDIELEFEQPTSDLEKLNHEYKKSKNYVRVPIHIDALGPLVLTKTIGDRNTVSTHRYIPSLTLRGLFANGYIRRKECRKPGEDLNFKKWFLDGNLRFLTAYVNESTEMRKNWSYIPTPFSLHSYKGTKGIKGSNVFNLLLMDTDNIDRNTEPLGGFMRISKEGIWTIDPETNHNFHHTRDSLLQHAVEGNIFYYEALKAHQNFLGYIQGEKGEIEAFCSFFPKEFISRVGKSRSAQYGKVLIKFGGIESYDDPKVSLENCTGLDPGHFIVTFKSPCILKNENGFSEATTSLLKKYLEMEFGLKVEVIKAFSRTKSVENYVSIWKLKTPTEVAFAEGSTFLLELCVRTDNLKEKLQKICKLGIGERTSEGFGDCDINLICNENYTYYGGRDKEDHLKPEKNLPKSIFRNLFIQELYIMIENNAFKTAHSLKPDDLSNHQVSRLESILDDSQDRADFTRKIEKLRDHTQNILRRVTICENGRSEWKYSAFDFLNGFKVDKLTTWINQDINFSNFADLIGFEIKKEPNNFVYHKKFLVCLFREIRNINKKGGK